MTNRYAAPCARCGQTVAPGTGETTKAPAGSPRKWDTVHGTCPTAEAPAPAATGSITPTPEQAEALAMFASGRSFVIEAGAGCGKTATLRLLAESTTRTGGFMAFNRAIVEDAKASFPSTVVCRTVHSWAFASEGRRFASRLQSARMSSEQIARTLRIDPYFVHYGEETKVLQPGFLAGQVMRALRAFCNSEDLEPTTRHFAYIDGIDLPEPDGRRTYAHNDAVREALLPALRLAWTDWQNPDGQLRYDHDAYVKLFSLGEAKVPVDYITVDEAQDLSGVMVAILRKNAARGVQIVAVGDPAQTIYGWRGSVSVFNPEYAEMWSGHTTLTTSYRFGQPIADVANLLLDRAEATIRLTGNPDRESTVGEAAAHDAVLTRTNAAAIEAMFKAIQAERSFHLVGGGDDVASFCRGAEELQRVGRTGHPELACFTSWQQVLDYVANDPSGDELKLMVQMIETYGADTIRTALERQVRMDRADLVISTTHRAKGLQFDRVRLAGDFADPGTRQDGKAEWRLMYVAATRAKFHLDHTGCGPVWDLTNPADEDVPPVVSEDPSHVTISGITDLMDAGR